MTAEVLALNGSYADQAYERVLDRLVMLDIRPGEPIDDDRLATELGSAERRYARHSSASSVNVWWLPSRGAAHLRRRWT